MKNVLNKLLLRLCPTTGFPLVELDGGDAIPPSALTTSTPPEELAVLELILELSAGLSRLLRRLSSFFLRRPGIAMEEDMFRVARDTEGGWEARIDWVGARDK